MADLLLCSTVKTIAFALFVSGAALTGCSADGWVNHYGSASSEFLAALAVGGNGDTAVAGLYDVSLELGDSALSCDEIPCGFVAALDPQGHTRFSKSISGGHFTPRGIAPAGDGTWLLVASYSEKAIVAGVTVEAFGEDVMLASFDAKGEPRWIRHFSSDDGGPTGVGSGDPMAGVAVDAQGNIAMAGMFAGTFGFGGPPIDTALGVEPGDLQSTFVVSLDANGEHRWTKELVDPDLQTTAAALCVTPGGDVLVGGTRLGMLSVGTGYLARFDSRGALRDDMRFEGPGTSAVLGIAAGPQGEVVVTGQYQGHVTFADRMLPLAANRKSFVIALSPEGKVRWIQTIGDERTIQSSVSSVAVDDSGALILGGTYIGKIADLPVHPVESAFVTELRPDGEIEHIEGLSPTENDDSLPPFVGAAGQERRVAGTFQGTLTTGGEKLVNRGLSDFFVSAPR